MIVLFFVIVILKDVFLMVPHRIVIVVSKNFYNNLSCKIQTKCTTSGADYGDTTNDGNKGGMERRHLVINQKLVAIIDRETNR